MTPIAEDARKAHLLSMTTADLAAANIAAVEALEPRSTGQALLRGFVCRCPNCGKGALFGRYLKPVAHCSVCGEDYTHQRADDAPPYFTMVIVGHLLVPLMLAVQFSTNFSVLTYMLLWIPFTGLATLALLQPVKGAIIGWQWALRMHGFGSGEPPADFSPAASLSTGRQQ
jgi:uncharacterized protein (DUF983 family)